MIGGMVMDEQPLFDVKGKDIPRVRECFICGKFILESIMHPVEVPSQGSEYVTKLICDDCLNKVLNGKRSLCPECLQLLEPDGSCLTCRLAKRVKELEKEKVDDRD